MANDNFSLFDMKYDDINAEDLWNACLFELAREVEPDIYKIWIKPLTASLDGTCFTLYTSNRLKLDFIQETFKSQIQRLLVKFAGDDVSLKFAVSPSSNTNTENKVIVQTKEKEQSSKTNPTLLPIRHPQGDFFTADLLDYALKEDGVSMEAPIFTLSTKPDLSTWEWRSKDGNRYVKVVPSMEGRATQFDKDVLIYVISQITAGKNSGRDDAKSRSVRFTVYDYLVATNKPIDGASYTRLKATFARLRGTSITTDIRTAGEQITEGFGIIDKWKVIKKSKENERMIAVEITLSEWLYNAVQANEVLTIDKDYFRLRKPLERRLYELARKHCGSQKEFKISLELLHNKTGSKDILKRFKYSLNEIIENSDLLGYTFSIDANNIVTIQNKQKKLQ